MTDLATDVPAAIAVGVATVLAFLDAIPVVQDTLIGAGIGTLAGKLAIRRLERRHGELASRRVREIEAAWITALAGCGAALSLAAEIL